MNPAPTFDNGNKPEYTMPLTPVQKVHERKVQPLPVFGQPQTPTPRPFVKYASSVVDPAPCDTTPPNKHVRFQLLPPAEIKSIAKPPTMSYSTRAAEIKELKAKLEALEANGGSDRDEHDFQGYECLDVSMGDGNVNGSRYTPEIRLFQFEKQHWPLPRGDLGRSNGFGAPLRKKKAGVPHVSPLSFYQGVAVPPSARADKGKQRALVAVDHTPSSPLQGQLDGYTQQRYLTSGSAGPSRDIFM